MTVRDIFRIIEDECEVVIIDSTSCRELADTSTMLEGLEGDLERDGYMDCEVLGVRGHSDKSIAVYIDDPNRVDIRTKVCEEFEPYEIADVISGIIKSSTRQTVVRMDGTISETEIENELEQFFVNLKLVAENQFNRDMYRVVWNAFQAIADIYI